MALHHPVHALALQVVADNHRHTEILRPELERALVLLVGQPDAEVVDGHPDERVQRGLRGVVWLVDDLAPRFRGDGDVGNDVLPDAVDRYPVAHQTRVDEEGIDLVELRDVVPVHSLPRRGERGWNEPAVEPQDFPTRVSAPEVNEGVLL